MYHPGTPHNLVDAKPRPCMPLPRVVPHAMYCIPGHPLPANSHPMSYRLSGLPSPHYALGTLVFMCTSPSPFVCTARTSPSPLVHQHYPLLPMHAIVPAHVRTIPPALEHSNLISTLMHWFAIYAHHRYPQKLNIAFRHSYAPSLPTWKAEGTQGGH